MATKMSEKSKMAKNSAKYYINKLTKDMIKAWQSIPMEEHNSQNETMNMEIFVKMLKKLGFKQEPNLPKEHKLLLKLWRYMGGRSIGHLTLNNFRQYLFAVQNISIEMSSGIEK
jgi:hypothetical protein